jgi:hypothetical protein
MKIALIALISLLNFGNMSAVYAATTTAKPTEASTSSAKPIEDLKDRLATTVAQLHQIQRKALVGDVKTVSVSSVTISTKTSDVKLELTDTLKIFQVIRGKRTALTIDNLTKGDHVVVFGDYDSAIDLLKAQVIVIQDPLPARISGTITAIDKKDYTVTLLTPEGQSFIIDIWTTTTMFAYDPATGVVKGGFSKLIIGEVAHIVGTVEPKEVNRISALRFLDIGMIEPTPTPTVTVTPTATASATPKVTSTTTIKPTPTK